MSFREVVDTTDAAVSLGTKLFVVLLVITALYDPALFGSATDALGITEFDLFGVKVTRKLAAVDQSYSDLKAQFAAVSQKLADTSALLEKSREDTGHDEAQTAEIRQTLASNRTTLNAASLTIALSARAAASNAQTIASAQILSAPAGSRWGIVFGADTSLPAERHEANLAKAAGLANVTVYHRGSWYRSVIEFPDRATATAALLQVQGLSTYAAAAYVVNITTWCQTTSPAANGIVDCATPSS